jgi:anti-sigma regulatory factor (Ser/Thr protein kinase)
VRTRRQESTLQLAAGECLFLYSDGLVESRARPVGEGVDTLLSVMRSDEMTSSTADEIAGAAVAAMLDIHEPQDDATVLVVRWTGTDDLADGETPENEEPPHVASTKLRPEALASSSARHFVRALLDRWQLLELSDVAELCVSELVTNAVLHARTPIQLEVRAGAGMLHVDVCDSGGARIDLPPREEPGEGLESGRGLYIVQALSSRTGVRATRSGTCVWFELDLPGGEEGLEEHAELTDLD